MDPFRLQRQTRALSRLQRYHLHGSDAGRSLPHLAIALAREAGVPAGEVAEMVGSRLGWPVYDHALIEEIARRLGAPVQALERLDEKPQSWLLDCFEGAAPYMVSDSQFVHTLVQVARELAEKGKCIIVGRGAALFLPPERTLRVHLVGTRDDRVAAFRDKLGINRETASRRLDEANRAWFRFVTQHFYKDPMLPQHYDLVLNASEWEPSQCADLIVQAVHAREEALQSTFEQAVAH